jgi:putative nucleotidyltransferase with HDIG domain
MIMTGIWTVSTLMDRIGELPPMPQVAKKAMEVIRDPESNMASLAKIVSMDEAMTTMVLRWVNSAYYGLKYPVATVQQAITFLGQRTLHSLILATSVASILEQPAPGYGLDRGDLWKHAIGVAAGARLIATKLGQQLSEEAYYAGLLCDIGKLAFEVVLRNVDLDQREWQGKSFEILEQEHFGVDHAALGAELASRWRLPSKLVDAIACHHQPSKATDGAVLAAAVHLADAVVISFGIGLGRDGLQYSIDPVAIKRMGWDDSQIDQLAARVIPFVEEADEYIRLRRKY